ncbi:hypothetical protein JCM16358_25550 [Halanaerocella petrolearia]
MINSGDEMIRLLINNSTGIITLSFLILIIITLMVNIFKRKKVEEELRSKKEELQAYNEEMLALNEELEGSYQEVNKLATNLERIINLTSNLTKSSIKNEESFLSELLNTAIELIPEADYGSVHKYDDNQVKFVDTVGHNLTMLQELSINKDNFQKTTSEITIIDDIVAYSLDGMEDSIAEKFKAAINPIKQSITFDLYIDNQKIAGISLDIADDSQQEFDSKSEYLMKLFKDVSVSFYTIQQYNSIQNQFQQEIVFSIIEMLEIHDEYTKGHSDNVAGYAKETAKEMNLSHEQVEQAYWAGMVHDIGKTLIPSEILNKQDRLTDEEYSLIKQHPIWAYYTLQNSKQLEEIASFVLYHHERWDGMGYPEGIKGEEIPLVSQILSVADAWDAMRSNRSYRSALPKEVAIEELKKNKGTQFSPQVIDAFLNIIDIDSLAG